MTPEGLASALLAIDLGGIAANWRQLDARAGAGGAAAVLKADAYGLGLAPVARALWRAGCRRFYVAQVEEGAALRATLPDARIAVLNGLAPGAEPVFRALRLLPVLNDLGQVAAWRQAAARAGHPLPAQIHLDTGMNRLGLPPEETERLTAQPERLDGIALDAWITHPAAADDRDSPLTATQADAYRAALARLPCAPAGFANSSGLFREAAAGFDFARPGSALFGINPTPETANPMAPVVNIRARVLQLRRVDSPMTVGYGAAHRVRKPTIIATVAIGYADGLLRSTNGRGHVRAGDALLPIVGRISMDLITVDATAAPALAPGDLVEVIGPHRDLDRAATEAGTIGYELLTGLGRRFHRVYAGGG